MPQLATALVCSGARAQPLNAASQLACADTFISANRWATALPLVRAAFEVGSAADQCEAVRRIDRFSPHAGSDAAPLDQAVVRACRVSLAAAPGAVGPATVGSPGSMGSSSVPPPSADEPGSLGPRPSTGAGGAAALPLGSDEPPERADLVTTAGSQVADAAPLEGGFQLTAGVGAGNGSGLATVELGYGTSAFALSFAPSLLAGGTSGGAVAGLGLGISARIYFVTRKPSVLVPFLRPEVLFGVAGGAAGDLSLAVGALALGAGFGCEYLFNAHAGLTADLGLRVFVAPVAAAMLAGSVGIVLHQ